MNYGWHESASDHILIKTNNLQPLNSNYMKTLKITFLLALFLTVSSQTYKTPKVVQNQIEDEIQEAHKMPSNLIVHIKDRLVVPTQG